MSKKAILSFFLIVLALLFACAGSGDPTENDGEGNGGEDMREIRTFGYSSSGGNSMAENSRTETTYYLFGHNKELTIRIIDEPNGEHYEETKELSNQEFDKLNTELLALIDEHGMESYAAMEPDEAQYFATDVYGGQELRIAYKDEEELRWSDSQIRPEGFGDAVDAIHALFEQYK